MSKRWCPCLRRLQGRRRCRKSRDPPKAEVRLLVGFMQEHILTLSQLNETNEARQWFCPLEKDADGNIRKNRSGQHSQNGKEKRKELHFVVSSSAVARSKRAMKEGKSNVNAEFQALLLATVTAPTWSQ